MKKILCSTILATMMFMSVESFAQNVYTDEQVKPCGNELWCTLNGKLLTGIMKRFYPNGNLMVEATYKDGKLEGLGKLYYENGNLKDETTFKDGKPEGLSKRYYENGNLRREVIFESGQAVSGYNYGVYGKKTPMTNAHLYNMMKDLEF